MNRKLPLVSVVLSVYNAEVYLDEAIQSILNQTYTNFEFIIINDGSTDNSLKIIKKYRNTDDRIILISRENKGLTESLNEGILKSKGKYIARMDADDISMPKRFEAQVEFLELNIDVGICGTWVEVFGQNLKTNIWKLSTHNSRLKTELVFSSCFAHPSVMIRKDVLINNKLSYDKKYPNAEDFQLWTELADLTNFANINKVLLKYRVLETSITRIADKNNEEREKIIYKILNHYLQKLELSNTTEEDILHYNLSVNSRMKINDISFDELKRYFKKLELANNNKNIFNSNELKKVLGKKWFWNIIYRKNLKAIFSKYFLYGVWGILTK